MDLTRIGTLAILLTLLGGSVFAQDAKPDLAELWETGSLWEVGDNRELVKDARQELIDAGEDGLKFALTKLDAGDTLHIRCLRAVFKGFGASAYEGLVENITNENATARRNVAELLAQLDDPRAAEPLLEQCRVEESLGTRLAQLASLAKWKVEDAIPLLVEISQSDVDRIRHRATSLLGEYEQQAAVTRLIEMLDDAVFYVRDGARDALKQGTPDTRGVCLARLLEHLALPGAEQNLQRIRLLLPIVASLADDGVPAVLELALKHESGLVRGDAASALVTWKQGAGLLNEQVDVIALLNSAIDAEYDPYAKSAIETARNKLTKPDTK
ncbi:MAG: HEAT repeat domain-containing protein [Planctomycetota bacterium]